MLFLMSLKKQDPVTSPKGRTLEEKMAERSTFPVRPVSEIKAPRSWAIYGRSGSGKTTFSSTFPGPTLLLDIDDRGTE